MTSHYSEEFTRDKPYSVTVAFISHFNALHQTMKGLLVNDDATFFQCVEELAKTNQVIKRNHQFLDQIRQLRNLLTHHKTEVEVNLAYPSEETNQQLFEINKLLTEIPSTRKFIKPVFAINMDDSLEKALTDLHHPQVIKRNHQFLDQIRQLRNLLTHHKTEVEVNLAYPSEETNQQLFEINKLLTEIPSTRKFIKPVFAINMDDSLEKALTDLHHHQV